jgi:hypothetical protein
VFEHIGIEIGSQLPLGYSSFWPEPVWKLLRSTELDPWPALYRPFEYRQKARGAQRSSA